MNIQEKLIFKRISSDVERDSILLQIIERLENRVEALEDLAAEYESERQQDAYEAAELTAQIQNQNEIYNKLSPMSLQQYGEYLQSAKEKPAPEDNLKHAGKWIKKDDQMINLLSGEIKPLPVAQQAPEVIIPINFAIRRWSDFDNGYHAEFIVKNIEDHDRLKNLIERYNAGEIA